MAESTILTGQFVRIAQTPASIGERFMALLIDAVFLIVYVYATAALLFQVHLRGGFSTFLTLAVLYLPVLFYPFLCEMFNHGQSLGKRLVNIRVVKVDGSTPGMGAYLLRWLLFLVDLPLTGGLGVVFILFTKNSQRLGDLAAGTMVVKEKNYKRIHVSLDEFAYLTKGYQPVYPQASDLSLVQVDVITRTLQTGEAKARAGRIVQLAAKVQHLLGVTSRNEGAEEFLQTILRDYQYYALEEV
jgi:uncharacterized RDD family membrane protein YckC